MLNALLSSSLLGMAVLSIASASYASSHDSVGDCLAETFEVDVAGAIESCKDPLATPRELDSVPPSETHAVMA